MSEPIRVLLVGSEEFTDDTAARLEHERGAFDARTETDPSAALDRFTGEAIDCVVSDHDPPETDGLSLLEAVRNDNRELPFVLFADRSREEIVREALAAGATDYISNREQGAHLLLANRIESAVSRVRAERALAVADQGIVVVGSGGTIVRVNRAFADRYGYEPEELLGASWQLLYGDVLAESGDGIFASLDETGSWKGTLRGERKDGTTVVGDHTIEQADDGAHVCVVDCLVEHEELEQLREDQELLDAIFEQLPAHLFVQDTEGRYLRVRDFYGEEDDWAPPAEEHIGKTAPELFPGELAEETLRDDKHVVETGEPIIGKEQYLPFDDVWNLTSKVPWYDDDGNVKGLIGIVQRITDQKHYEQELERQNERLEKFASIVSHDLRNPLNVVEGRLELAREEHDSDHLDAIPPAIDRMKSLIEDVLALARQGQSVDETSDVVLSQVAERSWRAVETGDVVLQVETDRSLRADESRLVQALENLFRNAREHGGEAVTVWLGALEDGFYVEDDGPGIPEDERQDVFEYGYTDSPGGSGLGLNIVREIVRAHGWEIAATEGRDGGVRFEITGVAPLDS